MHSQRFIFVESAFFSKWWVEQDDLTQKQVKELVDQGRLEFIGGAWSMNVRFRTFFHIENFKS